MYNRVNHPTLEKVMPKFLVTMNYVEAKRTSFVIDAKNIVNVLQGLRVMINLQTVKLHDTMSQCFKLDNYNDQTFV